MLGEIPVFLAKFADDIVLISPSEAELQPSLVRLSDFSMKRDLVVHVDKSVTMSIKGRRKERIIVQVSYQDVSWLVLKCSNIWDST